MKRKLILQVLGNSDIQINGREGAKYFTGSKLEDLENKSKLLRNDFHNQQQSFNFPLLEKLIETVQEEDTELIFGIILTDQGEWSKHYNWGDRGEWRRVIGSDGIWWQDILSDWFEQQNFSYYPLPFEAKSEDYGVADWEGMSARISPFLQQFISFSEEEQKDEGNKVLEKIYFYHQKLEKEGKIEIDEIIVQHSSGTPALTSALYLWGIEQKLARRKIKFIYISEPEEKCPPHSGKHWQWHLRLPIIRELVEVQDFSGAAQLLKEAPSEYGYLNDIKQELDFLDKSVSLNINDIAKEIAKEIYEQQNKEELDARDSIIERVSIALWSEQAFRQRSHWMHWCLRMAGAFELALLLLVERKGNEQKKRYEWMYDGEKHEKLIFDNKDQNISKCSINDIVEILLTNGEYTPKNSSVTFSLDSNLQDVEKWEEFKKKFYLQSWYKGINLGFIAVRNKLYHQLIGDKIDKVLDTNPQPADIAVNWLEYVIGLAGVTDDVNDRMKHYQERVEKLKEMLGKTYSEVDNNREETP